MGVKGLWKLIECSGVPVPLETLEHKVLGVDVSIWLHQAVRGFRGPGGAAVANAHLLTLFHRICKLLFYRIRPVFVFDGGVPHLKKQTLASRRLRREVAASKAKQVRERLLSNLLKSQAVRNALGRTGPGPSAVHVVRQKKVEKDIFDLPPLPEGGKEFIKSEPEDDKSSILKNYNLPNLHQFEFESQEFKSLPLETQHEILSELQGMRKENSWNSLNNMPQESTNFAEFQMGRLMKRYKFQSTLNNIREEMQKKKAAEMEEEMFGELEKHVSLTQRIVSEDAAHSIFIKKIDENKKEESVFGLSNSKGKSPMKKSREDFEKDFLTELEKQGIVSSKRSAESDSDSDLDDDYHDFNGLDYHKETEEVDGKLNFDGQALLKVMNNLLDNDGLSQDEILALIKQNDSSETKKESTGIADGPSTSGKAAGFIFNPDVDSSDDDSDFIEVSEPESPSTLLGEKAIKGVVNKEEDSLDNVKKVLETKNSSLWIKIMQQKLDDIVHIKNTKKSPNKALVSSRSGGSANQEVTLNGEDKKKGVSISLDFDAGSLKNDDDDIFADVFLGNRASVPPVANKPEKRKSQSNLGAIAKKVARYSSIHNEDAPPSAKLHEKGSFIELVPSSSGKVVCISKKEEQYLKEPELFGVQSAILDSLTTLSKAKSLQEMEKKEANVVEVMSSSDDSDLEDCKKEIEAHESQKGTISKLSILANHIAASNAKIEENNKLECEDENDIDDVEIMSSSNDSELDPDMGSCVESDPDMGSCVESDPDMGSGVSNEPKDNLGSSKEAEESFDNASSEKTGTVILPELVEELNARTDQSPVKQNITDTNARQTLSSVHLIEDVEAEEISRKHEVGDSREKIEKESSKEELPKVEVVVVTHTNNSPQEEEKSSLILTKDNEEAVDVTEVDDDVGTPERPLNYSEDELKRLEGELAEEQSALVAQAQKVERISSNLNDQMYGESQHLLQLFGIPYIVAPMEAEAQCGYLDAINLTSGTITDDSDIFLFGGTKVYKNFFNQAKHVEFFKTDNISSNLGLDRDKMITLALLTGSDYTEGIESVGAVSAMEVLTEFPGEGLKCLQALKKWWNVAHKSISASYLSKARQKLSQVHLPESFPSENVYKAYLEPEIDESREKFSWAIPNVDALRLFTMEKFGWSRAKADEILLPVMKKLGVKSTQMRIDSFFTNIKLVKDTGIHSKRMQDAIAKAKGEEPPSAKERSPLKRLRGATNKTSKMKKRRVEESAELSADEMEEDTGRSVEGSPVKKPSRTLLIDPSETTSGPETSRGNPPRGKPKGSRKPKKNDDQEKKTGGPGRALRNTDEEEYVPPRKLTKEIMYEALLKKPTIVQKEVDKQEMKDKKRLAAEILKKGAGKGKGNT